MKKYIIISVSLAFFFFSCNSTKEKRNQKSDIGDFEKSNTIKSISSSDKYIIAFYNVENLFDTINDPETEDDDFTPEGKNNWNQERYSKKLNDLSWVLSNLNEQLPTLIGLAEVENRMVVEDLAKNNQLIAGKYKVIHEESPDTRGIDVALLYRSDLFEYFSHESIKVEVLSDPESKLRNILYVKGRFFGSDTVHIFVNHWKSRRGGKDDTELKRIETAEILREHTDNIFATNKLAKIIIMGDMNDEPENKSLNSVLFATNNSKNPKPNEFHNLMYTKSIKGEGTNSYDGKWFMLDNLIVSQSLADKDDFFAEQNSGQIFMNDKILYYNAKADTKTPNKTYGGKNYYGGFSDHLAVYFILKR